MAPVWLRSPGPRLSNDTRHWAEAGIISPEQAEAIVRFEQAKGVASAQGEPAHGRQAGGLPLAAELLSFLGIVLVAVSGTFVITRFWSDLHVGGRLAVGLAVAAIGLLGGTAVTRLGDDGALRLGGFLWLCGTGGVALAVAVAADTVGDHDVGVTVLAVGLAVFAVSVTLWRNRDRPMQLLSVVAGIVVTAVGLDRVLHLQLTPTEAGVVVWWAAVGLGFLGTRKAVHPASLALIVAALGALEGALAIATAYEGFGLALGLTTAAAALAGGLALRHNAVVAVGVVGFLVFLGRTLGVYFQGTVAAIGVFIVGIVLVLGAIWFGIRKTRTTHGELERPELPPGTTFPRPGTTKRLDEHRAAKDRKHEDSPV